jgi:hypothetical protein
MRVLKWQLQACYCIWYVYLYVLPTQSAVPVGCACMAAKLPAVIYLDAFGTAVLVRDVISGGTCSRVLSIN